VRICVGAVINRTVPAIQGLLTFLCVECRGSARPAQRESRDRCLVAGRPALRCNCRTEERSRRRGRRRRRWISDYRVCRRGGSTAAHGCGPRATDAASMQPVGDFSVAQDQWVPSAARAIINGWRGEQSQSFGQPKCGRRHRTLGRVQLDRRLRRMPSTATSCPPPQLGDGLPGQRIGRGPRGCQMVEGLATCIFRTKRRLSWQQQAIRVRLIAYRLEPSAGLSRRASSGVRRHL